MLLSPKVSVPPLWVDGLTTLVTAALNPAADDDEPAPLPLAAAAAAAAGGQRERGGRAERRQPYGPASPHEVKRLLS